MSVTCSHEKTHDAQTNKLQLPKLSNCFELPC
jgi:hypothetical protein